MPLLNFFADLYNMELHGYITVDEIAANWGRSIQEWAACTVPLVEARRVATANPVIYDLEPLLVKVRTWERRRGAGEPPPLNATTIPAVLDEVIDRCQAMLRQEAAWQSGHMPERPTSSQVRELTEQDDPRT